MAEPQVMNPLPARSAKASVRPVAHADIVGMDDDQPGVGRLAQVLGQPR